MRFRAFQIWYYDDIDDLIKNLKEYRNSDDYIPEKICCNIWEFNDWNIESQREMIKN